MNSNFKTYRTPQLAWVGSMRALMVLLVLFVADGVAWAQTNGLFDLTWSTVNGASGVSSSGNWQISGTAGQPDAGTLTNGAWVVFGGFWNQQVDASPIAGLATFSRTQDLDLMIAISNLLAYATNVYGNTNLSLVSVSAASTNDAAIFTDGNYVFYSPPGTDGNVTDSFNYIVADPYGDTGEGTVVITIQPSFNGPSVNITSIVVNEGGSVTISFAGIPSLSYLIQTTTSLTEPITWTTLSTVTAGTDGQFQYTDETPTSPSYYRTATPSD